MAFTAPDVSSVSQLLHRWEVGEYISEAFVILGCAGELVADLATCISRRKRRHIERWSTILLVLALTIGLKCLIRTNELSGIVIGSLGERAEEADKKAKAAISDSSTALSQAKDALDKARKAQESLGKAEGEAKRAQSAAFSALNIAKDAKHVARDARHEADSFDARIVSATNTATEAESHLADALKEAVAARTELDRIKSPRSLVHVKELIASLSDFKGSEYTLFVFEDQESIAFLKTVDDVLQAAQWIRRPQQQFNFGNPTMRISGFKDLIAACIDTGISLRVGTTETPASLGSRLLSQLSKPIQAAVSLRDSIGPRIMPPDERNVVSGVLDSNLGTAEPMHICVGKKP